MKELEKQLKAMGNYRRLAILKYLKQASQAPVGDISREIKLSFKSTSRHLAILRAAEIVDKQQQGLAMFYYLSSPRSKVVGQVLSMC